MPCALVFANAFFERGVHNLRRREANAFVNNFHAGIARAYRDLLRAIRMTIEAGLTDQKF